MFVIIFVYTNIVANNTYVKNNNGSVSIKLNNNKNIYKNIIK
jgi:hypothetical protein